MEMINEIWPFAVGQQHLIFNVSGLAVLGLIGLNFFSAIRQKSSIQKVVASIFVASKKLSKTEVVLRAVLLGLLVISFLLLIIDVKVNGMQLISNGGI